MKNTMEKHISFTEKTDIQLITGTEAGLTNKNHWAAIRKDNRVVYSGTMNQVIRFLNHLGFRSEGAGSLVYRNTSSCPVESAHQLERILA